MLRLHSRPGEDTKIEIRLPDSAANPYLAIAATITAGIEGIEKQLKPGKVYSELKKEEVKIPQLPDTLTEAIKELEANELMRNTFGEEFIEIYVAAKQAEWLEYMEEVSEWEIRKYLGRL